MQASVIASFHPRRPWVTWMQPMESGVGCLKIKTFFWFTSFVFRWICARSMANPFEYSRFPAFNIHVFWWKALMFSRFPGRWPQILLVVGPCFCGFLGRDNFTHLLIYANSSLAEQTIPTVHEIFAPWQKWNTKAAMLTGGDWNHGIFLGNLWLIYG